MEKIIIIGAAAFLAITFIILYNRLVGLKQTRNNALADIDVQLKMRHDLIPNMVETVKKYTQHEKDIFENVATSRSQAMNAHNINDKIQAEAQLDGSLMKLMAVTENYPDLKADNSFNRLQAELSNTEKGIAAARRFFNNATAEYNTAIQLFPTNLVAKLSAFPEEKFFELDASEKMPVQVSF